MLRERERMREKERGKEEEGGRENFKGCPYDHHTTFQRTMQRHKATNDTSFLILVSHGVKSKSNNKTQRRRKMVRLRMCKYSGNFSI